MIYLVMRDTESDGGGDDVLMATASRLHAIEFARKAADEANPRFFAYEIAVEEWGDGSTEGRIVELFTVPARVWRPPTEEEKARYGWMAHTNPTSTPFLNAIPPIGFGQWKAEWGYGDVVTASTGDPVAGGAGDDERADRRGTVGVGPDGEEPPDGDLPEAGR